MASKFNPKSGNRVMKPSPAQKAAAERKQAEANYAAVQANWPLIREAEASVAVDKGPLQTCCGPPVLTMPYPPSSNHFHAVVRGRKITSAAGREFLENAAFAVQSNRPALTGPIAVTICAYRPRKSGDVDNIIKPVLDGLTRGGVYEDDRQIVELHVYRGDDKARPRVEIEVTEIQQCAPSERGRSDTTRTGGEDR